jgi:hypothetical protein
MATQQIKVSISVQKKLSLAAGILSAIATFVSLISKTWGFEGVGEQIVTTFLAANTVINLYFFGSTSQKITEEKKDESGK